MLYVSTSRKPSVLSRKLVRWLALLCGGMTENRGKRSVFECMQRAESKGFKRLAFVYEKYGNPSELAFFQGQWLNPVIEIQSIAFPTEKKQRVPKGFSATAVDEEGKKIVDLFTGGASGLEETETGLVMQAGKKEIKFVYDGETVGPVIKVKSLKYFQQGDLSGE